MRRALSKSSKSSTKTGKHVGLLSALGLDAAKPLKGATHGTTWMGSGPELTVRTPIDGSVLARVTEASAKDYDRACRSKAANRWTSQ